MISLYHSEFCRIRRASGSFRVKPGTRKSSACYGTPRGSLLYLYDDSFLAPAASAVRLGSDLPPPCPAASHQPAVLCKGSMAAPVSVNAVGGIIQHSLTSGKWQNDKLQVASGKWANRVMARILGLMRSLHLFAFRSNKILSHLSGFVQY